MESVPNTKFKISVPLALVLAAQHIQGMQINLIIPLFVPIVMEFLRGEGVSNDDIEDMAAARIAVLAACFFWTCSVSGIAWGYLADIFGRRFALISGLCLGLASNLLLAFSTTFPTAVAARILAGLDGNMGINKILVGDLTPSSQHATAFALLEVSYALATIASPALGGLLPGRKSPLSGDFAPAFWPGIYTSVFITVILILVLFLLPETKAPPASGDPSAIEIQLSGNTISTTSTATGTSSTEKAPSSFFSVENIRRRVSSFGFVLSAVLTYALAAFVVFSTDQLVTHGVQSAPRAGGLGLPKRFTGYYLLLQGILRSFSSLLIFPIVATRKGPIFTFRIGSVLLAVVAALFYLATQLSSDAGKAMLWPLMALRGVALSLSVTSAIVLVSNSTLKSNRGSIMGFNQSFGSLCRGMGSFVTPLLLAAGRRHCMFWLPYLTIALVAIVVMLGHSFIMPKSLRYALVEPGKPSWDSRMSTDSKSNAKR